jgi:hypothetical protein
MFTWEPLFFFFFFVYLLALHTEVFKLICTLFAVFTAEGNDVSVPRLAGFSLIT